MPNINIDDAYILDNTGKQVDDAVDYALYNSNRNLLDNPWFTVRQRGNGPFTGNGVTGIDRWKTTNSNSTVKGNDGYITFTAASGGNAFLAQYTGDDYEGTYTYSAYIRGSGAGYIAVTNADRSAVLSSKSFDNVGNTWTLVSGTFTTSGTAIGTFTIRVNAGGSIDIKCVKLEKARTSTLENDAPPDYGEELAKCQRYFYRMTSIGSAYPLEMGFATSATNFRVVLPTHCSMRTPVRSVTMNGGNFYAYGNGVAAGLTSVSYTGWTPNGIVVTFATSGLTATAIYALMCNNASSYIDISCDI